MGGLWLAILYLGVVLTPLVLAAVGTRPPRPLLDELASGAGMLAFAILLAEFLLSGRFRMISGSVGMDITMRFHQLLARTALLLAVVHPFLYVSPFGPQLPFDPTRMLTLKEPGIALATGAAAWILLPAFVLTSIARSKLFKTYEVWRWGHGLGAAVIAGFAWHHTVHAGRYAEDPVLKAVWTGLLLIALLSLASVYVGRPLMQLRRPWQVREVNKVADRMWEVVLSPLGHNGLSFAAGQFAWINIGHSSFSLNENPFSIASAPSERQQLRFVIKELGDFTSTLGSIETGTPAYVDGPHGNLTNNGLDAPGIGLIAGGVGIAPMLSILREMEAQGDRRPVKLIYGNRHKGQIVAGEELKRFALAEGRDVIHVVSEPGPGWKGEVGLVDTDLITRHFGEKHHTSWDYLLCGPPAMMTGLEDALIDLGIAPGQILSERFSYD
jgi:predicted ferric reductase